MAFPPNTPDLNAASPAAAIGSGAAGAGGGTGAAGTRAGADGPGADGGAGSGAAPAGGGGHNGAAGVSRAGVPGGDAGDAAGVGTGGGGRRGASGADTVVSGERQEAPAPGGGPSDGVVCEVWWARPAWARPELLELLDDAERARHARFRLGADRDRYAVAHALARVVCARAAGCGPREVEFELRCRSCERRAAAESGFGGDSAAPEPAGERGPHGKPHPTGPASGWEISISHSGERVVVAITRGVPVGVDAEQVKDARDITGLADYVLTPPERAAWEDLPDNGARTSGFFTYWARKEALLKATGDGLSGGLTSVSVSPAGVPAAVTAWDAPGAPAAVRLTDLDAGPGYRAALAVLTSAEVRITEPDAAALLHRALDR